MWIATTRGFYSIVEKPWDTEHGTLTIRARSMVDMLNLATLFDTPSPITQDDDADYLVRFQAPRLEVSQVFATLLLGIGYDNFKGAVAEAQGPPRAVIYERVWGVLRDGIQGTDSGYLVEWDDPDDPEQGGRMTDAPLAEPEGEEYVTSGWWTSETGKVEVVLPADKYPRGTRVRVVRVEGKP